VRCENHVTVRARPLNAGSTASRALRVATKPPAQHMQCRGSRYGSGVGVIVDRIAEGRHAVKPHIPAQCSPYQNTTKRIARIGIKR